MILNQGRELYCIFNRQGLAKTFGTNEILRHISFDVSDGEFCVLVGPSGCGKSTILRLIAGLEKPTHGEIVIDGSLSNIASQRTVMSHSCSKLRALSAHDGLDNLAFSLRMRGVTARAIEAKVKEAAQLLEIDSLLDRRPHSLSGGQRQRVRSVAPSFVAKIFLFDEPLSNLDASLRATMRVELARLHRRLNATMIYVTHDQAEALTLR